MENKHKEGDLEQMQSLPLKAKILMSKRRICDWYFEFGGDVSIVNRNDNNSKVVISLVHGDFPDVSVVESKNSINPYLCETAEETKAIKNEWMRHGCNQYDAKRKKSRPLAFWTKNDIDEYVRSMNDSDNNDHD